MTSATGVRKHPGRAWPPTRRFCKGRDQRGFTLLEIILVIALIGGVTALAITNAVALGKELETKSFTRVLNEAIAEGTFQAMAEGDVFTLRLAGEDSELPMVASESDKGKKATPHQGPAFVLQANKDANTTAVFPLRGEASQTTWQILPQLPDPRRDGPMKKTHSSKPINSLTIHPTGVLTPARIVIQPKEGPERIHELDPFTGRLIRQETSR